MRPISFRHSSVGVEPPAPGPSSNTAACSNAADLPGVAGAGDGERWELPLLVSPRLEPPALPGFSHAFSTRLGGVSVPPFDALNLGGKGGDAPDSVAENRRRLRLAVGGGRLMVARQVHGPVIALVRAGDSAEVVAQLEADGLCSDARGLTLGVFVADCIPALLADRRTGAFAAVHAGWRGTVAGVLPAAVRKLAAEFGARPGDLRIALGPAIGPCCFEVGGEVVAAFLALFPDARAHGIVLPSPRGVPGKSHVDLKAANRLLLGRTGVAPEAIDAGPECTHCDRARFFSFRRDGSSTGHQMGVIGRGA